MDYIILVHDGIPLQFKDQQICRKEQLHFMTHKDVIPLGDRVNDNADYDEQETRTHYYLLVSCN